LNAGTRHSPATIALNSGANGNGVEGPRGGDVIHPTMKVQTAVCRTLIEVSTAWPIRNDFQAKYNQSMADEAVNQVIAEYYRDFSTLNVQAILRYFNEPSLLVGPQGVGPDT
jgi:hypothetical protein